MERVLYDQLYNYLTKFELLSDCQFGFQNWYTVKTAPAILNEMHVN